MRKLTYYGHFAVKLVPQAGCDGCIGMLRLGETGPYAECVDFGCRDHVVVPANPNGADYKLWLAKAKIIGEFPSNDN